MADLILSLTDDSKGTYASGSKKTKEDLCRCVWVSKMDSSNLLEVKLAILKNILLLANTSVSNVDTMLVSQLELDRTKNIYVLLPS
jgi:hypothetical protein